ncbi:MAG: DUF4118 domain-containing protein [Anaerolineae bacterium]|nr:MAG: DUF4118 domain-containing protein [Anaerolineae bacterium]
MKFSIASLSVARLKGYFLALVAVAAVTAALLPFRDFLSTSTVALLYLLPVLWISTSAGLGAGLLCGLIGFLTYNFFFLEPYHTFTVHQNQDLTALLVFLLVAILIGQLVGRARDNLDGLMAREKELITLYELTLSLAGQNEIEEITEILTSRIWQEFKADGVEVDLVAIDRRDPYHFQVPAGSPPATSIVETAVLESPRRKLGEIRIARARVPFTPHEQRMLQAFANQGTMAIERTVLAEAETKAKVLEESDRLKSALLSSVSHEFNTPLATIKASVTSLLGGDVKWDTVSLNDLLGIIHEETDYLIYLVGNLLNMSRIEANALKPEIQWNVLSEIVEDTVSHLHRNLEAHRLEIDLLEELPLVPVDYVQMQQVFTNLLSNSIKYSPPGTCIRIGARETAEWIQVTVQNQGPSVAPEHLNRIFDKFYRLSHAEKVFGTGLGLSICKGIIEAHGGQIWAENVPDGLAFRFTLPRSLEGHAPDVVESENT